MSRSVRIPMARSSWSMTTTDPTRRSCMRCAATATVSAGCAVTTGRDMTSATVRSPGAGMCVSGMGPILRLARRRATAPSAVARPRRDGPRPAANRIAPSSDSPEASVAWACRNSTRIASSSGRPHCSYDESRSPRRQIGGSAASSCASVARRLEREAGRGQPVRQPHAQRFVAADASSGQDEIERMRVADQAGQPHGAAVDERHTPTPAVHTEHGVSGGDPEIAPERELEPARHRVALDRRDHGLAEQHAASGPSARRRLRSRRCRVLHLRPSGRRPRRTCRGLR